ncbi:MAG: hypothetical protein K5839_08105 [Treponemataceae bacterium]|nr:hypothetical protein [Treponemataceae bacterium]
MKKTSLIIIALALCAILFTGCGAQSILPGNSYTYSKTFSSNEELEFFELEDYCSSLTGKYTLSFNDDNTGNIKLEVSVVYLDTAQAAAAKTTVESNCAEFEETFTKAFAWTADGNDVDIEIEDVPVFNDSSFTDYSDDKSNKDVTLTGSIDSKTLSVTFPELVAASMFVSIDADAKTVDFTLAE